MSSFVDIAETLDTPTVEHEYDTRFTPLDMYVELGGEVYQLIRAKHNGELFFVYHGKILSYDRTRDGIPLDIEVVRSQYPEYLL